MGALPLQLILFASCAWAIQFRLPQATNSLDFVLDVKGITPRPTPPPAVRRNLLGWKRASSAEFLGWLAPDNTCGYVQGSLGAIKTCYTDQVCGAVYNSIVGTLACFGTDYTGLPTAYGACIDSAQYSASCNNVCRQDINTVKCTDSDSPYCFPYSIPDINVAWFSCDSVSITTFEIFLTTFVGETDDRTWSEVYDTPSSSIYSKFSLSYGTGAGFTQASTLGTSSATPHSMTTSAAATTTSSGGGGGGGSSNAGAIAGGVVGGIAVLALAGLGIFYIIHRKRETNPQLQPRAPDQPAYGGSHPPMVPHPAMDQVPQSYSQQPYKPYQPVQPPPPQDPNSLAAAGYFGPNAGSETDSYATSPGSPNPTLPRYSVAAGSQATPGAPSPNPETQQFTEAQLQPLPPGQYGQQVPSEMWAGNASTQR